MRVQNAYSVQHRSSSSTVLGARAQLPSTVRSVGTGPGGGASLPAGHGGTTGVASAKHAHDKLARFHDALKADPRRHS